jgi:hypothetical protein
MMDKDKFMKQKNLSTIDIDIRNDMEMENKQFAKLSLFASKPRKDQKPPQKINIESLEQYHKMQIFEKAITRRKEK